MNLVADRNKDADIENGLEDMGWGGREAQEGGDVCIHIADSLCSTAETNPTL